MTSLEPTPPPATRSLRAMCLVYFAFGMPIAMLGVAWPSIRDEFDRPNGALGILATCYGIGRLALAGSGGLQLRRRGFGRATGLAVGCLAVASAAIGCAPSWPFLLVAVSAAGLASGAIDGLGGRFMATVASVRSAGLLAGSYGVGATVGPAIVAIGDRWRWAYAIAAIVGAFAAVSVLRPALVWPDGMRDAERPLGTDAAGGDRSIGLPWTSKPVIVSALLMVCFVGIEVTMGSWAATFFEDARSIDARVAGLAVSGFWAGVTLGRLALGVVRVEATHLLVAIGPLTATIVTMSLVPGWGVIVVSVFVGASLAPFFPVIMATTGDRVGQTWAPLVSGRQLVFGNVGGTSMPALTGVVVAVAGEWSVFWVLLGLVAAGAGALAWASTLSRPPR